MSADEDAEREILGLLKRQADFEREFNGYIAEFEAIEKKYEEEAKREKNWERRAIKYLLSMVAQHDAFEYGGMIGQARLNTRYSIEMTRSAVQLAELASRVPDAEKIKADVQSIIEKEVQGLRDLGSKMKEEQEQAGKPRSIPERVYS
jgi:hypothetical protein